MGDDKEIELKKTLGIESWHQLSKTKVFDLLDGLRDADPEVALQLISQFPEFTNLVKVALDDAANAHEVTDASNTRSIEMAQEVRLESLSIYRAQLDRDDLTESERLRIYDDIARTNAEADQKDTENKAFLSERMDQRLRYAAGAVATVVAVVVGVAANKKGLRSGRLFKS